ncbi:hypothetical protein [Bacillus infantis]|jgi:hypothetical protein|uniref:hypothetical protein n=1 Tax=Bacillus infantis TaxID=324767 RepID=UPI0021557D02|nr:hypothetical protein [Bacillus infantis]MCR6612933.1 hypothetical protein [Bacillus infantis]
MRFLTSLATSIVVTSIFYLGVLDYGFLFVIKEYPDGGENFDSLGFLLLTTMIVAPLVFLILTVTFTLLYKKWNIKKLLFISLASIWISLLLNWLSNYYSFNFRRANNFNSDVPPTLLFEISNFIIDRIYIFPPIFIVIGYLIMRRKPSWFNLNASLLGIITGYVLSYGLFILWRIKNNSLTSYHYFDAFELGILAIGSFVGLAAGIFIGRSRNKSSSIEKA